MARLTNAHKRFVVGRLASFETPSDVRAALNETFNVDAGLDQIVYYDPTTANGARLKREFKELFHTVREQFIQDTSAIACAHRTYRLARIQKMLDDARHSKNPMLVKELLREAREEMKGMDITGLLNLADLSDEELEQLANGEDPIRLLASSRKR